MVLFFSGYVFGRGNTNKETAVSFTPNLNERHPRVD